MTAAAARPPLFDHLVASRPERERHSLSSTAASIALHAALVVGAIAATAQVRVAAPTRVEPVVFIQHPRLIEVVTGKAETQRSSGSSSTTGGMIAPPSEFDIPNVIPPPGRAIDPLTDNTRVFGLEPAPGPVVRPGEQTRMGAPGGDFVAVTVLPKLLNRSDVQRAMIRLYPNMLLQAGIGGTTVVWLRLDEAGRVMETQVKQSSGQKQLDDAAQAIGKTARFSPALNGAVKVRVWVELPVVFSVGR